MSATLDAVERLPDGADAAQTAQRRSCFDRLGQTRHLDQFRPQSERDDVFFGSGIIPSYRGNGT